MNEVAIGIVCLCLLLGLFLTGIELAFAMAIMGAVGFAYIKSIPIAIDLLANDFFDSVGSYSLTVVPLFVLMGQIAFNAGIAKQLYDGAHKFMGRASGGLAIATIMGASVFKAICGSNVATAAMFAGVAVPEMDKYGYSKKLSTGIVAVSGTLGVLLPPSVPLIIFGLITEESIGKLFLAGIVPGILLAIFFIGIIVVWCRINPSIGPRGEAYSWKEKSASLPNNVWPIIIFIVMLGGLMKGIFSPTEAGSIGAFAVLLLCVLKKNINFKGFVKSTEEALRTSCMVLMLIACSATLAHFIVITDIPQAVGAWLIGLPVPRVMIMSFIFVVYLIGGSFVDDLAFMILATPIFYPVIIKLGYDPIWAGIIIAFTVAIGSVIPPIAICVFVVRNVTKVPMGVIYAGVYPFLISLFLCLVLLFIFPDLALYLPRMLMK